MNDIERKLRDARLDHRVDGALHQRILAAAYESPPAGSARRGLVLGGLAAASGVVVLLAWGILDTTPQPPAAPPLATLTRWLEAPPVTQPFFALDGRALEAELVALQSDLGRLKPRLPLVDPAES